MKLTFQVPTELDVRNVLFDADKKEVSMELVFYGSGGSGQEAMAGNIEITAYNGDKLFCGEMRVSGLSGKPSISTRTASELSILEQRMKAGKAATWGRRRRGSSEEEKPVKPENGKTSKPEGGALAGLA